MNSSIPTTSKRFAETTAEELREDVENAVNKNTLSKSKWAINIYKKWLENWRVRLDELPKVLKEIHEFTKDDLDYSLQYFYSDMRKEDCGYYPPQTQKDIVTGIQYYFNNTLNWSVSLFNDKEFSESRKSLNAQMKKAAEIGLIKPKKKAVVIPIETEEEMWQNGTFGWSNPKQLQDTLIYFLGYILAFEQLKNIVALNLGKILKSLYIKIRMATNICNT